MKISSLYRSLIGLFIVIVMLTACGEENSQPSSGQENDADSAESTAEPTPAPEIEPEVIDLGYDAELLVRGLPNDVALDAVIDLSFKDTVPDSRNYDNVHSEIALVSLSKNGGPTTVDNGVIEICYKTTLTPGMNEQPIPYYWDTSKDPLVDGRPVRASNVEKEPNLLICMMVQTSGAYALIAR